MDTDAIVAAMTATTVSKITKQEQNKQILTWQMEGVQSITEMLVKFGENYTSLTSSSNLAGSTIFNTIDILSGGANSSSVTATSASGTQPSYSIGGAQEATSSSLSISGGDSSYQLSLGSLDGLAEANSNAPNNNLAGTSLTFDIAYTDGDGVSKTQSLYISFPSDYVPSGTTEESVLNDINSLLNEELSKGYYDSFREESGITSFSMTAAEVNGNDGYMITSNTGNVAELATSSSMVSGSGALLSVNTDNIFPEPSYSSLIGQSMTFDYSGTSRTITFTQEDIDTINNLPTPTGKDDAYITLLQSKLDSAFGSGKIEVSLDNDEVKLTTAGTTDTLTLTGATSGLTGDYGAFSDMKVGATNRLDLSSEIDFDSLSSLGPNKSVTINGTTIEITEGMTISSLMSSINDSAAGVTMSYGTLSNSFKMISDETGEINTIDISDQDKETLAKLFGGGDSSSVGDVTAGKDATILIKFDGDSDYTEINRASNTFVLDGTTISVNKSFGEFDDAGNLIGAADEDVTFTSVQNVDNLVDAVKGMVEAYNEIVAAITELTSASYDKDYLPLTDDERAELSESEIAIYEEKAKTGVLYGDTTLLALSSELRTVFSYAIDGMFSEDLGINISSYYSENGKLTFDEDKFRAAAAADPEGVTNFFNNSQNGVMTKLDNIVDKYAETTGTNKGLLVKMAGYGSATSLATLSCSLYSEMQSIDDYVATLKDRLQVEEDRYYSQFSSLEVYVSQMNSQAEWLASQLA